LLVVARSASLSPPNSSHPAGLFGSVLSIPALAAILVFGIAGCSSGAGSPSGGGSPGASGGTTASGGSSASGASGSSSASGGSGGSSASGASGGSSANGGSSASGSGGSGASGASGGTGASGGSGGSTGGGGGSTGGGGGSTGGGGGSTGGGGGSGGSADGGVVRPFTCNLLIGPSPLGQWFNGGFLTHPGIDATKWEAIVAPHHYIPDWSPPNSTLYDTPMEANKCAKDSTTPDRIIFHATQWAAMPVATWESNFSGIVMNIQKKWPSVRRIELMLSTVGPGDMPCSGGTAAEQSIQANGFIALDAMPAMFPGLISYDPPAPAKWFEVTTCSDFVTSNPQYTASGAKDIANMFGDFFAMNL
jgi:hypothetical protein